MKSPKSLAEAAGTFVSFGLPAFALFGLLILVLGAFGIVL